MKILYIIKDGESETLEKFINTHRTKVDVRVLKIDDSTSSETLLKEIEEADKIISW